MVILFLCIMSHIYVATLKVHPLEGDRSGDMMVGAGMRG
jgi:hypothetical protein